MERLGVHHDLRLHVQPGITPKYEPLPGHSGGYSASWDSRRTGFPHTHLDISFAYRDYAEMHGVRHSLKPVAESFGFSMITVDRANMHELTPQERRAYTLSDVHGTRYLGMRLLGVQVA